jgi:hypothetical protein
MRENRLSGSEGGATLIPSSLPLSFILVPPGQSDFASTNHQSLIKSRTLRLYRYLPLFAQTLYP